MRMQFSIKSPDSLETGKVLRHIDGSNPKQVLSRLSTVHSKHPTRQTPSSSVLSILNSATTTRIIRRSSWATTCSEVGSSIHDWQLVYARKKDLATASDLNSVPAR